MKGILKFLNFEAIDIDILEKNDSIDPLYSALKSNDLADAVMIALDIINKMKHSYKKRVKCEITSSELRLKGNLALHNQHFRDALICYNAALMFAPTNSESMILALSNRSELLLRFKATEACLKDIERCQTMKCSVEIIRKLEARKSICINVKSSTCPMELETARENFKLDTKRNKDFPCASEGVDVVKEDGIIKIIAARDIELGELVAIEPAFVSTLNANNYFTSCFYCHKVALALIPCEGCCSALFCNEDCKEQCFKQYHNIECHIIDVIDSVTYTPKCKLSIVAALKFREMFDSWDDLIAYSLKMGKLGIEDNSKSEQYHQANMPSALNFNHDMHFIHGKYFNQCFVFAVIIKYLSDIPNYLPKDVNKETEAQRALARVMLSLFLKYPCEFDIENSSLQLSRKRVESIRWPNFGLFNFMSKLTHNCEPNLYYAALGNKLAMIAVKSIKKGMELTFSIGGHWCDTFYPWGRSIDLFMIAELKCQCRVCIQNWYMFAVDKPSILSDEQKKYFDIYDSQMSTPGYMSNGQQFSVVRHALEMFQDGGNTREFKTIFIDFCRQLTLFQCASTQNIMI